MFRKALTAKKLGFLSRCTHVYCFASWCVMFICILVYTLFSGCYQLKICHRLEIFQQSTRFLSSFLPFFFFCFCQLKSLIVEAKTKNFWRQHSDTFFANSRWNFTKNIYKTPIICNVKLFSFTSFFSMAFYFCQKSNDFKTQKISYSCKCTTMTL